MKKLNSKLFLSVCFLLLAVGCNNNSTSTESNALAAAPIPPIQESPNASAPSTIPSSAKSDLSDDALDANIKIKRLTIGDETTDVLDPNPKGDENSSQASVMTMALCAPRFTDKNVNDLSESAYPIVLSSGAQVLMHRDHSYEFADGSDTSSVPPYVLLTCKNADVNDSSDSSVVKQSSANVQVKHLHEWDETMEVLDPNPKGASSSQTEKLILVVCAPRITDANLSKFSKSEFPILLSQGSQIALKRDMSYQFGDGSSAASDATVVIISCE
jgi:hypothetical protein